MSLGTLKKIDVRTVWTHEAYEFTKWLAQEDNLHLLSEEIGISINLIRTEAPTGRYTLDILAEEEETGRKIIIENQLEYTDHRHLGQIITYASGYDAEIIIWIVKGYNDEHLKAVEWLNSITDTKINFFLIQIELWQIDESKYASKFDVVAKPNEWSKILKEAKVKIDLTDTKLYQLGFWETLKENNNASDSKLRFTRTPRAQHWYDVSAGSSSCHISLTINTLKKEIGCGIYIPDSKQVYHKLHNQREEIEQEMGVKLTWKELPEKKASRILLTEDIDAGDQDNWDECFKWLNENAERFYLTFSSRL